MLHQWNIVFQESKGKQQHFQSSSDFLLTVMKDNKVIIHK